MNSKTNLTSINFLGKKRNISHKKKEQSLIVNKIANETSNIDKKEIVEINKIKKKINKIKKKSKSKRDKLKKKMQIEKEKYIQCLKYDIISNEEDNSKKLDKIINIISCLGNSHSPKSKNNIIKLNVISKDGLNENNIIPYFEFRNDMNNEQFLDLFESLMININDKKPKNIDEISSFFKKIGNDALYTLLDDKILTKIKRDIIIQYNMDRGIYNSRANMDTKFIIELIKGTEDSEFRIEEFDLNFTERKTKDRTQSFKINKDKISDFLKSESVLSAAQDTLFQFKDTNLNNVQKAILKNKVDEFIYKTKFYKMKMNEDNGKNIYAFTIYDGSIFINEKYIQIANDINDMRVLSAIAIILTTLFHEFIHFLVRILSNDHNSNNYFLSTKHRQKKDKKTKMKESGDFLDYLLFNEYLGFYEIDAIFLLNINNYAVSYKLFCENFKLNNKNNSNKLEKDTFLKKGNCWDDSTFIERGYCLYSILRGC